MSGTRPSQQFSSPRAALYSGLSGARRPQKKQPDQTRPVAVNGIRMARVWPEEISSNIAEPHAVDRIQRDYKNPLNYA